MKGWAEGAQEVTDKINAKYQRQAWLRQKKIEAREEQKRLDKIAREKMHSDAALRAASDAKREIERQHALAAEEKKEMHERHEMAICEAHQRAIDRFWGIPTAKEKERRLAEFLRRQFEARIRDKRAMMVAVGGEIKVSKGVAKSVPKQLDLPLYRIKTLMVSGEEMCEDPMGLRRPPIGQSPTKMLQKLAYSVLAIVSTVQAITFRDDGSFTVVQFADLHSHNGGPFPSCSGLTDEQKKYPCSDKNNTQFMSNVLDVTYPDLVVFTGDNNDAGAWLGVENSVKHFLQPTLERELDFAAVFGNHDEEANLDRDELMDVYMKYPGFLGEAGPSDIHGYGNYILTIDGETGPEFNLWFFDSGDYSNFSGIDGYDWVWGDQIQWYVRESKEREAANNGTLNSFAFFHIPLPEYEIMLEEVEISGLHNEGVCHGALNSGLFATMVERGEIKAATVGHDHCNDFCGNYHGIDLCYGGGTGYDGYGCAGTPNWARRSRVIELSDYGRTIKSWKILDDGLLTKIDEEVLFSEEGGKVDRSKRKRVEKIIKELRED
ncbi:hypothetical protein TL16_g10323 [Triparma laevis f. inornata]|uniref:Calcineurin-like phosphoesterase domain-containing protein n=1 Tax=Triparma laevis f. inornata TaxID=1714386 RepID=A0A9W7BD24_9STRA|nr:hypothetical protein TL16_g10323 [Triparma laevis f. inornata]